MDDFKFKVVGDSVASIGVRDFLMRLRCGLAHTLRLGHSPQTTTSLSASIVRDVPLGETADPEFI